MRDGEPAWHGGRHRRNRVNLADGLRATCLNHADDSLDQALAELGSF